MHWPQSPRPSDAPSHTYPSPPSKSPPPRPASKFFRELNTLRHPLADITNLSIAQAAEDLGEELGQVDDTPRDVPVPKGRGKNKRGKPKVPPAQDQSLHSNALLHSPAPPVQSPRPSPRASFNFRLSILSGPKQSPPSLLLSPTATPPADTPEPQTPPSSTASSTTKHALKWTQRRLSAVLRSPPPTPTPARRRNYFTRRFSAPSPRCPSALSSLPEPGRRNRAKRELAELQWLVTLHRSLSWRVSVGDTRRGGSAGDGDEWGVGEDVAKAARAREALGLGQGGLMIAFEPAKNASSGEHREDVEGVDHEPHWMDLHDRELVARLEEQLVARGCTPPGMARLPIPVFVRTPISVPVPVSEAGTVPFPTSCPPPSPGIPFPSHEDTLAPAIELASTCPASKRPSGPRRRVSATAFPSRLDSRPRPSAPPRPPPPVHRCSSFAMPPPPQGVLTPVQLVAQIMFRRSQACAKPIRRYRAQVLVPVRSGLGFAVACEE